MNLQDFLRAVYNSNPDEWIFNDQKGVYVWKSDLNVRILREEKDDDSDDTFNEPWVKIYPDKSAHKINYHLYYGVSFIKEELLIAVDGYRAYIPIPKSQNLLQISKNQKSFGAIINFAYGNDFEDYLKRAKIATENNDQL